ncbi:MAG: hypothetical protein EGP82_03695 [Odoribacter splanchnicus]|nr:hypothetical protein [Odoribacter splanchnicus]
MLFSGTKIIKKSNDKLCRHKLLHLFRKPESATGEAGLNISGKAGEKLLISAYTTGISSG